MGAPGRPPAGVWGAIGQALAVWATLLSVIWVTIWVARELVPTPALAQSAEISKTEPAQASGQTEIRKSRPGAAGRATLPEQNEPALPEARWEPSVRAAPQDLGADLTGQSATVTEAEVTGDAALTHFSLLLSARVRYRLASLANPYRIVIDMPDVDFRLPVMAGQEGGGLIRAYRYGLFGPGRARVIIDTTRPVRVNKHAMTLKAGDTTVRLVLDLVPTDEASFLADVAQSVAAISPELHAMEEAHAPTGAGARPVIVIDPGHGGPDPGAIGDGFREKDVVLAVALQVRAELDATDRYDVYMTRSTDVFIPLGGRVAFSRQRGASLFVSIHANSVPAESQKAAVVRGAAVYTLSEEASTREAQRLAENENAADLLAGAESRSDTVTEVDRILADLKWRETSEFSAEFRGRLLTHLKGATALSREPAPSAAFVVLRQGDCPSVLVELGYVSNAKDAQLLVSPDWQRQVAVSIAASVNEFFTTRERRP
ncbi:MAG: N-acetylmuramoyl-L-alanine amidase [Hyphomicrobiaceae bacterium]|nr:N-acetylmuramoyl-L-alanine amidase [Hyphomicrobiaceae bacterium]